MQKLSGNDVIELWAIPEPERSGLRTTYHVDRQVQDQRAKLVFHMIQHWGMAAALGESLAAMDGSKPAKKVPPQEIAMLACEVVDAAWNELRHRGWIVDLPSFAEIQE